MIQKEEEMISFHLGGILNSVFPKNVRFFWFKLLFFTAFSLEFWSNLDLWLVLLLLLFLLLDLWLGLNEFDDLVSIDKGILILEFKSIVNAGRACAWLTIFALFCGFGIAFEIVFSLRFLESWIAGSASFLFLFWVLGVIGIDSKFSDSKWVNS